MNCNDIHERLIPTDTATTFSPSSHAISLPVIKHLLLMHLHGLLGFAYALVRSVTREYLQTITRCQAWRGALRERERETHLAVMEVVCEFVSMYGVSVDVCE